MPAAFIKEFSSFGADINLNANVTPSGGPVPDGFKMEATRIEVVTAGSGGLVLQRQEVVHFTAPGSPPTLMPITITLSGLTAGERVDFVPQKIIASGTTVGKVRVTYRSLRPSTA